MKFKAGRSGKGFVQIKPQDKKAKSSMAKAAVKTQVAELPRPVVEAPLPERRVNLTSLTPISEAMGADKSPREILQLILKAAFSITRASSASLMLTHPDSNTLTVEVAEGFKGKRIYNTRLLIGQGVTGWVAETGVPLRIGNVRKDPRYVRVQQNLRSELAVPLKIGGSVIGVISVDSTRLNHFTAEDEALLSSLAAQSARVIQTTRLYEEARRRAEELELLSEVSRGFSSTLDLRSVLAQAVEQTARVCRADIVSVFLISENNDLLEMAACHGGSDQYRQQPGVPLKGSLLGRVMATGKPAIYPDVHAVNSGGDFYIDSMVQSLLAVPLMSKDKAVGILCVYASKDRTFDKDDERVLSSLARSAALAIENARAHRRMLAAEEGLRSAEKFSMLGELAAGLAHEIRNPLTSIKVLFGTLCRLQSFAPESQQDADMINKQIARLETIVEGFLSTARAQVAPMQQKIVDVNATVDESMLLLVSSANEGTRLTIDLSDKEILVRGDGTQISQVVYNLVLNAMQAVEKRGRINVRTGRIPAVNGQTPEVFLEVADDGPGLPENVQLKLFQPFVTTKKGGVGLGLSIVKRIVEAHGGRLEVESPRAGMGHGALFRAVLPEAVS
ncbi:MAG TPA: GAF domain-containing protein [Planctomycetota bacterium]|nr:GAF domain-containing protein [Planctomycetota bacterium]